MTYAEFEESEASGEPLHLYHFVQGVLEWNYTDGESGVVFNGDDYFATAIKHSSVQQGRPDQAGTIDVTFPKSLDLALGVDNSPTGAPAMELTIYSYHRSDGPAGAIIAFLGEVRSADIEGVEMTLQCAPLAGTMNLPVPRGVFRRDQCIWATYDTVTCKVNIATFTYTGVVADISTDGKYVTVTGAMAFDPGNGPRIDMFINGVMKKGPTYGLVRGQTGDVILLAERFAGLVVGDTVSLVAGDDHTKETCLGKFDNIDRYQAHMSAPRANPFYGRWN